MRVLLVGSDRQILQMTEKILRRNSYEATIAIGLEEALEALRDNALSLVILDTDIGLLHCRRIMEAARQLPLLLISGDREEEVPLLRAGADDWMQKPYQMEVLLARMTALLRLRK